MPLRLHAHTREHCKIMICVVHTDAHCNNGLSKKLNMQVMHSYGAKPNEDFLQYYGFVDTDNIHDSYSTDLLDWVSARYRLPTEGRQAVEADAAALHALHHVSW